MKNLFGWMLVVLLVLTAGVSCSDDEELLAGNGIADAAWSAENQVEIEGGVLNYTFAAASDWTARSSADWCEVQTGSGMAGESLLRLKVAKNTRAEARSATITVSVWGYASPVSFVVKQGKGLIEQGDGKYRSVNEWVAEYMKSRYLWNRAIENVSLDYSLCYDFFFFSILDGVAAQDEVNREDGHWQGQKRMYYYSRLESDAPLSRTPGEAYVGSGIYLLDATRLGDDYIGIVVMVVIPGTPAAEAGLVRGDFITAVNGEEVTESNYQSLGRAVYDGAVDVTVNSVTWTDNGTTPVLTPKGAAPPPYFEGKPIPVAACASCSDPSEFPAHDLYSRKGYIPAEWYAGNFPQLDVDGKRPFYISATRHSNVLLTENRWRTGIFR